MEHDEYKLKKNLRPLKYFKWLYLYRKWFNIIIGIIALIVIFCGITRILNYMYFTDNDWERILWHNFYEDNGKIENIYLGSSHVYCSINPMQLDDINGKYNFNLSSSSQSLNSSYYLLKEADKNNSLSHVYLELFYWFSIKYNSEMDITNKKSIIHCRNTDYMKNSYNKLAYILSCSEPDKYIDILFPFVRYRTELDNWDYIKETIKYKTTDMYSAFEYHSDLYDEKGYDEYRKQGYNYSTINFLDNQRLFCQDRIINENPIGENSEEYIRKIINYCQSRDIPITLFISPIDELQLISTENYDNYINQVREIAEECETEFYDFNLAKKEYLDIQHGECFRDVGHLNYKGSNIFTQFFSEVVSRASSENEKYFYNSYEEKLQSTDPSIYGLYYADSDKLRTYHIAANRKEGMEYKIILNPTEGNQQIIQDFAENNEFVLSVNEHGVCTIVARMKDAPDDVQTLEINY